MDNKLINETLSINENSIKSRIGPSFDIEYRHFKIPAYNSDALIVYIDGISDIRVIDDTILEPLIKFARLPEGKAHVRNNERVKILSESGIFTSAVTETNEWNKICDAVMEGDTALFIDGCSSALILSTIQLEGRSISEPLTESEVKGPRDGFVENIRTNVSLIRKRVKDYGLRFDKMKIGERTKTDVLVAYIDGLADDRLLKEVKSRLEKIKVDSIIASEYIEELIDDAPFSIFPKMANTERPDKASAAILEGRVVILVDNTPFAVIVPGVFWGFLHSTGDYYERYFFATFIRWVRLIAVFLSISASPLYVLLTSFHQEMLPTALALKIASGRNGVPFPAVVEAFMMEIILEIMKEAGLRMPKPMGQAVSIVGTLVIGQSAVSAGLVGPFLVIVVAVAAISLFAIPSYSLSNSFRVLRFPILISTAFFGLLGYLAGIIVVMLYLMSLRSFGTPYLAPVIPFNMNGNKDVLIKSPWWKMSKRPLFVRAKDKVRQASDMKPKPPPSK